MNIKFLPGSLYRGARLVTASGEILAEFGKDNEFVQTELYSSPGLPMRVKIILDMVVGNPATIIDGSVASNSLPEAPRALPPIEYDPNDYGPFFYNDAFEEDEQEWDEEECDS